MCVGRHGRGRRTIGIETIGAVGNLPSCLGICRGPVQRDCRIGDIGDRQILRLRTGRNPIDDQIVHVRIAGGGRIAVVEGNMVSVARVTAEDDLFLEPCTGGGGRIDRVHRHKGAGIGRIGHHAHDQAVVGGGGGTVPERGLQCVDRNGSIEFRRDGNIVVARGAIEVEGTYAGIMRGSDIRQIGRSCISGIFGPAEGVGCRGGAVCIEVLSVRQSHDRRTCGSRGINSGRRADFTAATVRCDIEVIHRGGVQARDSIWIGGGRLGGAGARSETGGTVLDLPGRRQYSSLIPGKLNAGRGGVGGGYVHRFLAGRNRFYNQIVDVTVTGNRRVLALEGDVLACAGIIVEINGPLHPG